ncbi:MAG: PQQ-binding-like beta-propeller repeat protein [Dehalococcoidia bacterium]|jgi:outer membrane protein assembly factor BamB|nr:PQQ-binding-like beta-propeller repeat protein [Dehalococcoidia bacterium]
MKLVRIVLLITLSAVAVSSLGCTGEPPPQGFAGVVSDGQSLFVGTTQGRIVALNPAARAGAAQYPAQGEWSYEITKQTRGSFGCGTAQVASVLYGNPVLSGGHICVGTYDGKVLMLDAASRSAGLVFPQLREGEWAYPRTDDSIGPVVGSPAVVGDVVYVSSSIKDGSRTLGVVYALDRLYGDELWVSEPLDGKLWVTPAVADGVVYVSTFEGHIYSLDAATGKTLPWTYAHEFGFVSSPFVADGTVYVASFDRSLSAIPIGAESPSWRFQAGNWFWATPVLANGTLFAPSLDGVLYALDPVTGKPKWGTMYQTDDAIASSPVVVGDSVVVVTKKGDVHVVNQATGLGARVPNATNEKATTLNAEVVSTPCYHDALVYVRGQNNVLYAVDPIARTVRYSFSLKME